MNLLDYLVPFALALGLLILVHELGHYLVARWCGVKVLRFSIGFGKPLIVKRAGRDDTEWSLAAFPLGGYVKMLDEREGPVAPAELHRSFNRQNVYRRFAIVAAGRSPTSCSRSSCTGACSSPAVTNCARAWHCPRPPQSPRPPGFVMVIWWCRSMTSRCGAGRTCAGCSCSMRSTAANSC
jgi:Predicted membrane-associated Zn-dependent proteases 1